MDITERDAGKAVVITISGRIESANAEAFRKSLLPRVDAALARGRPVVLDFSGVDYIGSGGERVLMLALKAANTSNTGIVVAALQPLLKEIFQISRFDRIFPCYATVEEALAALDSQ